MRLIDCVVSTLGLILLSPLLLLVAFAIRLDSAGPVLHRATRVGKDGATFRLYKFRSMVAGADRSGPGITAADDPRVTRVGAFVRRTKLDELPQLINVLLGEMSLVGPRPEDPRYVTGYTQEQRRVLTVRPGITSPASVKFRNEAELLKGDDWHQVYVGQVLPAKLAIELDYLDRRTLFTDLALVLRTVWAVLGK